MKLLLSLMAALALRAEVVLVVTADASDYVLAAGGTIAAMAERGDTVYVLRVTNDEKDSWKLSPEETASRVRAESEEAGRRLGVKEVIPLGYRAWELQDVSFTDMRDRIMFYVRFFKPKIMFIPNPYTEHNRVLDRYYAGAAAEDAWRSAGLENVQAAFPEAGLKPHVTPELYYFAQPYDPRRREPESTATFVPQPVTLDIKGTLARKIRAAQALKTVQFSMAQRIRERLVASGRRLPMLDTVNDRSVDALVEENVRGLAKVAAEGTKWEAAEEFRHAGVEYQIPKTYR